MTYLDSLAMIEKLKNLVWACNEEWVINFHFTSHTDFEIQYFKMKNWADEMSKIYEYHRQTQWHRTLPNCRMWVQDEEAHIQYFDGNFHLYGQSLLMNRTDEDMVTSYRLFEYMFNQGMRNLPGMEAFRISKYIK